MRIRLSVIVTILLLASCSLGDDGPRETRATSCGIDPTLVADLIGGDDIRWTARTIDINHTLAAGDVNCDLTADVGPVLSVEARRFTAEDTRADALAQFDEARETRPRQCSDGFEIRTSYVGDVCDHLGQTIEWYGIYSDRTIFVNVSGVPDRRTPARVQEIGESVQAWLASRDEPTPAS